MPAQVIQLYPQPTAKDLPPVTAISLITAAWANSDGEPRPLDEIISHLPDLLHVVLRVFLDEFDYRAEQSDNRAQCCRILASLISSLEFQNQGDAQ